MCSLSHPCPVHIQILSPNPTPHLRFKPIFSRCILRAYITFNVNLFFSSVFSFVLKTSYHFRLNNYLCIFSRISFFAKNFHTVRGIYKLVKYIFTTFCKIFTRILHVLFTLSIQNYVLIFFLLEIPLCI